MAFNPFEAFSIRSKLGRSVMAIIGIVVMLTFVLSSGVGSGNGFFDQIAGMFNSKKRGEAVAVGYGHDIYAADLTEIRRQRRAANDYLNAAVERAYANWTADLKRESESGTRYSDETKTQIKKFVNLRQNSDKNQFAYLQYLFQFRDIQSFFQSQDARGLQEAMSKAKLKSDGEDKRALEGIVAIIVHDLDRFGRPPYFLLPEFGDSDRDTLDFYLLLKKADQLGIKYSSQGIVDLISHDTLGRLGADLKDAAPIERRLHDSDRLGEITHDWLMDAIGNEYRARMALASIQGMTLGTAFARAHRDNNTAVKFLLGGDPTSIPLPGTLDTASALPGALTPYEFFEFYKDRCSEHTFELLEVSAEALLPQVTAEPTDKERKALYNKYRGELPDPSKDRPGFKEPRKVKVQFVTLDATSPRITQAIPRLRVASQFLCASAGVFEASPICALADAVQPAIAETMPIKDAIAKQMDANLSPYRDFERFEFRPRDVSVLRPDVIIGMLGGYAGQPLGGAMANWSLTMRYVERNDLKTRVPFLLQSWLTPFNPTLANAIGMPAFAYALNPKLPPGGVYLKEATETVRKRQRQDLFQADVANLQSKLLKIGMDNGRFDQRPDKAKIEKGRAEAKKTLTEWLKDRNLTPKGNKQPEDQYALVSDPDLKVLNDLAVKNPDGTNSLVRQLFAIDPQTGQSSNDVQVYEPFWFPSEPSGDGVDKPNYYVWVSEEIEPKTIGNNLGNADAITHGEMSKRVIRAWKLEKARELAKAEADRVAEQVRNIAKRASSDPLGVRQQLLDLAAEKKLRTVDLDGLALLKFDHEATRAGAGSYSPPKIEKSQVVYPTPDFADQLLELRKQPVGGVSVLADTPRTHYYVACEVSRQEKTVDQFREVFAKTNAAGPSQNALFEAYAMPEERTRALNEVRLRLRADAKLEEKDAFKDREKKDSDTE